MRFALALLISLALLPVTAFAAAEGAHAHHHHHAPALKKSAAKKTAATLEYEAAMVKMHRDMDIPYTGDADIDFVQGMIPHHQGAVDMALVELKYGKDPLMRWLAAYIIRWQEAEIGFMKAWINGRNSSHTRPDAEGKAPTRAYQEAMKRMHQAMHIEYTGNVDVDFARGMIPHHQGAIDMSWILKYYGRQQDLRDLMQNIIRSQGQEIGIMEDWLKTQGKH